MVRTVKKVTVVCGSLAGGVVSVAAIGGSIKIPYNHYLLFKTVLLLWLPYTANDSYCINYYYLPLSLPLGVIVT